MRGIESTVGYRPSERWSLDLFQSYNSTRIAGSNERLRQRPRYRAGLQLNYAHNDQLKLWAKNLYISSQLDSSIPTANVTLDSYAVADIGVQWQLSQRWLLNAQWKNLFSERYSNTIGNPVTDDTLLLQISYRGPKLF